MVGLIIEGDAPEAASFLRLLAPDAPPVNGFVGVVPRKVALELVGASAPTGLDWLADEAAGPMRKLPILVVAKMGFRAGTAEYRP